MRARRYLEMIWYKAVAELAAEAARAYIGILWWVVEPLFYMGAFYIAFGSGIRRGGTSVMAFLLVGLVPWKWFGSAVSNSATALQSNSGLILQVYLPKFVLPLTVVVSNTLKFFIILTLLLILLNFLGHTVSIYWISLPVIILTELVVLVAVSSLVAAIVPIFPDLKLIVDNGLIVMMFVSGIFFNIRKASPAIASILKWNPMAQLIESYRTVLIDGAWPDWSELAVIASSSCAIYAVAFIMLHVFDRRYAKLMIT